MNILKIIFGVLLFLIISDTIFGQRLQEQGFLPATGNFHKQRFNAVIISETAVATLATIGLQYLWYKKYPKSRFHFFDDNGEWQQMDKVGHATSAYSIAAIQYNLMRWSGVRQNSSIWIAGATALAYMSMIEISDGFSAEWGFSKGDMLANIAGTAIFAAQQSVWKEQKIQMRFSFHHSIYAQYHPNELGSNLPQRMLKDYNGQSYWLAFNVSSFLGKTNFPKWIDADFGYGAEGMTGAVTNPTVVDGKPIPSFERQRKLFFGVTGAFTTKRETPYPSWLNIFKVPSPVVEWKLKDNKIKLKPLYF
ncbi:MAG: YfiM family protein [Bacteroidota bacterium]|nr:YfiM family protein [Bacteroidota bacterium]